MSREVQGVIAQLAVQTPAGPKLVNADQYGNIGQIVPYQKITNLVVPANGTGTWVGPLPFGAHGIVISEGNPFQIASIQIRNAETGSLYYSIPSASLGLNYALWFPLPASESNSWQVDITVNFGFGPYTYAINAFRTPAAVKVTGDPGTPVFIQTGANAPIHADIDNFPP